MKRKGLSYKDVQRPFIVFKGDEKNNLKNFILFVCLIRRKYVNLRSCGNMETGTGQCFDK